MKAEEKKALGSSNSASGDVELVSGVFGTCSQELSCFQREAKRCFQLKDTVKHRRS